MPPQAADTMAEVNVYAFRIVGTGPNTPPRTIYKSYPMILFPPAAILLTDISAGCKKVEAYGSEGSDNDQTAVILDPTLSAASVGFQVGKVGLQLGCLAGNTTAHNVIKMSYLGIMGFGVYSMLRGIGQHAYTWPMLAVSSLWATCATTMIIAEILTNRAKTEAPAKAEAKNEAVHKAEARVDAALKAVADANNRAQKAESRAKRSDKLAAELRSSLRLTNEYADDVVDMLAKERGLKTRLEKELKSAQKALRHAKADAEAAASEKYAEAEAKARAAEAAAKAQMVW
ncbi:hypothetical protein OPQ81_000010 [Rhizoctonia solani]|nr:hypothetical protein OPQ81_000010 [Rhizoctonia solani]